MLEMPEGRMIIVKDNQFHGGRTLYEGRSLRAAVRAARAAACTAECRCGGPSVLREDGAILEGWEATPPFHRANGQRWCSE